MIKETVEYQLIEEFYGNSVAKRSQVPLINHIDEGLVVLNEIGSSETTKRAFCIHPMLQADDDLKVNFDSVAKEVSSDVLALAMEYRSVANEYLSEKVGTVDNIRLSPLMEVNHMLVADKVQNCKDFITYHKDTHPRSAELTQYFIDWVDRLGIDEETYSRLCAAIDKSKEDEVTHNRELEEKVKVYESLLHKMQLLSASGNHQQLSEVIGEICNWSYAHRSGNGEKTEEEQAEQIRLSFEKLKAVARGQQ